MKITHPDITHDIIGLRVKFKSLKRRFQIKTKKEIKDGVYIRLYVPTYSGFKCHPETLRLKGVPRKVEYGFKYLPKDVNPEYNFGEGSYVSDMIKSGILLKYNGEVHEFSKFILHLSRIEQILMMMDIPFSLTSIEQYKESLSFSSSDCCWY